MSYDTIVNATSFNPYLPLQEQGGVLKIDINFFPEETRGLEFQDNTLVLEKNARITGVIFERCVLIGDAHILKDCTLVQCVLVGERKGLDLRNNFINCSFYAFDLRGADIYSSGVFVGSRIFSCEIGELPPNCSEGCCKDLGIPSRVGPGGQDLKILYEQAPEEYRRVWERYKR